MADRKEIQERVVKIVSQILKISPAEIKPESNFVFDLGAESVDSIALVSGFEKEFSIKMDEDSALEVTTVQGAVDYIEKLVK